MCLMWRRLLVLRLRWLGYRGDRERLAGRYDRAEYVLRRALALAEEALPPDDLQTIALLNSLGMVHKYQGRFGDGIRVYRRAVSAAKRRVGFGSLQIATLYHNVG